MSNQTIFAWIGTDGDKTIEFMLYGVIVLSLLIATGLLYLAWWLLGKYVIRKKFSRNKSILAIAVLVLVGYFGIFVLPGIIRESNWRSLQAMCAEQVGYQSPDDNNNPQISTGESQAQYLECLGLDK